MGCRFFVDLLWQIDMVSTDNIMKPFRKQILTAMLVLVGAIHSPATATKQQLLESIQRLIDQLQHLETEDDDFESFCEYKKRILEAAAHQGRYPYPIPWHCPSGENTLLDDDSEDFSLFAWLKRMSKKMKLANE